MKFIGFILSTLIIGGVVGLLIWQISVIKKELKKIRETESKKRVKNDRELKIEEKPIKYNKLAIIGFILSIISIFGIGLAGLIGFILGIVALVQIRHTKERGRGLAIATIIVGFIWSFGTNILKALIKAGY